MFSTFSHFFLLESIDECLNIEILKLICNKLCFVKKNIKLRMVHDIERTTSVILKSNLNVTIRSYSQRIKEMNVMFQFK